MYGREVGFYSELSKRTTTQHPVCYFAEHDPETQDAVLLLEDVSTRGRMLDQVAGCSVDDARAAIRSLAQLHAGFWDDASLDDVPFLLRLCDDPYPGAVAFAYETAWPRVQEFFPELIDRTGEGVRRRVRRADPRAVREAVGTAARAVARRLAARQPLRHARPTT